MRDALVAALTLDIFNRHAEKVAMANVAQLINNLHSLFLAREDHFIVTPNFHVFEAYIAHAGGQSLRTVFGAPTLHNPAGYQGSLPGLAGSASLHDRQLVLTIVNPHPTQAQEAEIMLRGASVRSGKLRILAADDIHAHNSFEHPDRVQPSEREVKASGTSIAYTIAPASVNRFTLELG
jgi:alpha-N-arabinofuranosidase